MPSLSPTRTVSSEPQAASEEAAAAARVATIRRRSGMRRPTLPVALGTEAVGRSGLAGASGDGRALPAVQPLLEDRAQPAQRLAVLALEPSAGAQRLHQAVGEHLRLRLEREAHARPARGLLELV